jgi:hypothetical protein
MRIPSVEELRSKLAFDPDTGDLTWKKLHNSLRVGRQAKALDVAGYVQVNFGHGCVHKGHRIAWAIHYGAWPVGPIDHINGIRNDNRIANLREVDHRTNCQNVRIGSMVNKSTGILGVHLGGCKRLPYRAKIMSGGKQIHLGKFATPEEAHAAYVAAKRILHAGNTL